jgi:topoisomerase-4 subunit B
MYIGRIGDGSHYDDGCYILLKEVIDNAIDEFIMGYGKEVQIKIEGNGHGARFRARHPAGQGVDCVSKINTGAKYNDDVFQFSVGLNGVGTKAVNALSKEFPGAQPSRGRIRRGVVQAGQAQEREEGQGAQGSRRHADRVRADPEIFKETEFRPSTSSGGCGITAT